MIKLGGSVITKKDQPFTTDWRNLRGLAAAIGKYRERIVIVHGGGSYGHPVAKHFKMGIEATGSNAKGVTWTRLAMQALHLDIALALEEAGVHTYSLAPVSLVDPAHITSVRKEILEPILSSGLTPVTYGDVLQGPSGSFVISGDRLMTLLAGALRPRLAVFALDVDGVYGNFPDRSSLIRELSSNLMFRRTSGGRGADVTGGIAGKLEEALEIAKLGIDTYFVSGAKPSRVLKALKGEPVLGTLIRGKPKDE